MVDVTCQHCGESRSYPPSIAKGRKFCSWECRSALPRNNHPDTSVDWSCAHCGKTERRIRSRAKANRFCSIECRGANWVASGHPRQSRVAIPCGTCGVEMAVVTCLVGRKKYCSRACANTGRPLPGKVSAIATATADEFSERHPGIATEREMRLGRWSVDLALTDLMVAVEIDGTYWHSLPGIAEKDARKDAHLASLGWRVLRIPVTREPATELVDRIEQGLKSLALL
jgi:very-short-patch-repair endonuclease